MNENSSQPVFMKDKLFYRVAVFSLGITVITTAASIVCLTFYDKELPGALIALGSGCAGALGALFK